MACWNVGNLTMEREEDLGLIAVVVDNSVISWSSVAVETTPNNPFIESF